ncbi:hypothetical protein K5549_005940 [Capra hircus]|nr:hypothetical protein K5549_005940 [Capra hircus]
MAATALAARTRQAVWSVWAMQGRGFGSESADSSSPSRPRLYKCPRLSPQREQAEEERYFRARAKEQLAALKKHHENEISHHAKEIERLQKEIERHKQSIKRLKQSEDDD